MAGWFEAYDNQLEKLDEERQEYELGTENWLRGRTLLSGTQHLKESIDFCSETAGDYTGDGQRLQFLMARAGVHHLDACFLLVKNNLYNPPRSHIRYLYELYLLLKGLNEDWERSAEIYEETRKQLKNQDNVSSFGGGRLFTINKFDEIVGEQQEELKGTLENHLLWNHTSWSAVHPYSLEAIDLDLGFDEELEGNLLDMLNGLLFGISAQLVRTWEGTEFYWDILRQVDPLFVWVRTATKRMLPPMFDSDLKYWNPESYY